MSFEVAESFVTVTARDQATPALLQLGRSASMGVDKLSGSFTKLSQAAATASGSAGLGSFIQRANLGGAAALRFSLTTIAASFAATKMVKSAFEARDAIDTLTVALKLSGDASGKTLKEFTDLADTLQKMSKFSDEDILQVTAQAAIKTGKRGEELKTMAVAAVGLATKLGIDLPQAMALLEKAVAGNTAMFGRFGVMLDSTASKQEKLNTVLKYSLSGLDASRAKALTTAGALSQLGKSVSELSETLGLLVFRSDAKNFFTTLSLLIDSSTQQIKDFGNAISNLPDMPMSQQFGLKPGSLAAQGTDQAVSGLATILDVALTPLEALNAIPKALAAIPAYIEEGSKFLPTLRWDSEGGVTGPKTDADFSKVADAFKGMETFTEMLGAETANQAWKQKTAADKVAADAAAAKIEVKEKAKPQFETAERVRVTETPLGRPQVDVGTVKIPVKTVTDEEGGSKVASQAKTWEQVDTLQREFSQRLQSISIDRARAAGDNIEVTVQEAVLNYNTAFDQAMEDAQEAISLLGPVDDLDQVSKQKRSQILQSLQDTISALDALYDDQQKAINRARKRLLDDFNKSVKDLTRTRSDIAADIVRAVGQSGGTTKEALARAGIADQGKRIEGLKIARVKPEPETVVAKGPPVKRRVTDSGWIKAPPEPKVAKQPPVRLPWAKPLKPGVLIDDKLKPIAIDQPSSIETDQPQPIAIDQPSKIVADQPQPITVDQPSSIETDQPKSITIDQPSKIATDQPQPITIDQPSSVETDQPQPIVIDQPSSVETDQPQPIAIDQPSKIATDQPQPIAIDQPSKIATDQPQPITIDQPSSVETDQPQPITIDQPSSVETDQPQPIVIDQPSKIVADQPQPITVDQPSSVETDQPKPIKIRQPLSITADQPRAIKIDQPTRIKAEPVQLTPEAKKPAKRIRREEEDTGTGSVVIKGIGKREGPITTKAEDRADRPAKRFIHAEDLAEELHGPEQIPLADELSKIETDFIAQRIELENQINSQIIEGQEKLEKSIEDIKPLDPDGTKQAKLRREFDTYVQDQNELFKAQLEQISKEEDQEKRSARRDRFKEPKITNVSSELLKPTTVQGFSRFGLTQQTTMERDVRELLSLTKEQLREIKKLNTNLDLGVFE